MSHRVVDAVAPVVYAVIDFAAIMAPSLFIKVAADRGGMASTVGLDLVAASLAIGVPHAVIAWWRLRSEERMAVRRADIWIAAIDGLVVLALGWTLLLLAVLALFVDEHSALANRGYPVIALWAGLLLVAVALAEGVSRFVFWWLEPHAALHRRRRRHHVRRSLRHARRTTADDAVWAGLRRH